MHLLRKSLGFHFSLMNMIPMMALAVINKQNAQGKENEVPSVSHKESHGAGSSACRGVWYRLSSHASSRELSPSWAPCGSLSEREGPLGAFLRISYSPRSTVCWVLAGQQALMTVISGMFILRGGAAVIPI